jgi:nitroreductase
MNRRVSYGTPVVRDFIVPEHRWDEVPVTTLQRLLQAAVTAPSAQNRQAWRFMLLQDCSTS